MTTQTTKPDKSRMPTLFIPHGGGPCFFMDGWDPPDLWDGMAAFLKGVAATLPEKPKAILVISGHWEEKLPRLTAAEHPPLFFDYYGFPEHTYQLTYPAPGAPDLAAHVRDLLAQSGLTAELDAKRGFDHGVFIPFKLVYPAADIPVVQLSLLDTLDPAAHLALGRALAPLRDEGVLIVGSGMSFHNMRAFFGKMDARGPSAAFDDWLTAAVTDEDAARRNQKLAAWDAAPAARLAHPREEHLLPLMVAAGAAGDDRGQLVYSGDIMGSRISAYRFG